MTNLILGIDVSQQTVDVAYLSVCTQKVEYLGKFGNDTQSFKKLGKAVAKLCKAIKPSETKVILEPTGGYELALACFAVEQGWQVYMPNPKNVRQWIRSIGTRGKTDKIDARCLAQYGASVPLPAWKPMPEHITLLTELLKRKDELSQTIAQENNRLHALESKPFENRKVKDSLRRTIACLQAELAKLNDDIDQLFKDHPDMQQKLDTIKDVPGIGDTNAVFFLVLCYRWTEMTDGQGSAKALTAYLGLDPQHHQSGSSVHRQSYISRQGDRSLRSRLYMSALGGIRRKYGQDQQNPLKFFYDRLVSQGKAKKLALVACARKIAVWLWEAFTSEDGFNLDLASQH